MDQGNRQVHLKTALGENKLVFGSMRMSEALSDPYQMNVEMYAESSDIDFSAILGSDLTVTLRRPQGAPRFFTGIVTQIAFWGTRGRRFVYHAVVRPWLWLLTQTENCRIFHERKALDIVAEIFNSHGFDFEDKTSGSYPTYEYCVQYRESDFNFVSRLLEREGVFYYFRHENQRHTLVLADSPAPPEEAQYARVVMASRGRVNRARREEVTTWRPRQQLRPTRFETTDYNFKTPRADLSVDSSISRPHGQNAMAVYRYPGVYKDAGEGGEYAQKRAEANQVDYETAQGEANVRGLQAGRLFELSEHEVGAFNGSYFITHIEHEIHAEAYETGADTGDGDVYTCLFNAAPDSCVFRPPMRARKPLISGPQTAMVKNDTRGEEIEPDEFGRVKVAFHWEREGVTSCWVRVSQAWAGIEWGGMSIPRDGHEVVVEFIDGDPDRPLITGRVYNAKAMPPYPPKAQRTVTTFKTNSSKGGGGYNELRMDDKKGEESVFFHAQKDYDLCTLNIKSEYVKVDSHATIGAVERRSVGAAHETVGANRHVSVGKDAHRQVGDNIYEDAGKSLVAVAGKDVHVTAGANMVLEASSGMRLSVGGAQIVLSPAGLFIDAPMVMINCGGAPPVQADDSKIKPAEPAKMGKTS